MMEYLLSYVEGVWWMFVVGVDWSFVGILVCDVLMGEVVMMVSVEGLDFVFVLEYGWMMG